MTTAAEQKADFRRMLDESRTKTLMALADIAPEKIIYADSGWRLKDIIAHLTAWELEVTTSILAYNDGKEYTIPGFSTDDVYNELIFRRYYDVSASALPEDWAAVRAGLISAMFAIAPQRFDGQIMCPWKLYSGIEGIVKDMIQHEAGHLRDILSKVD